MSVLMTPCPILPQAFRFPFLPSAPPRAGKFIFPLCFSPLTTMTSRATSSQKKWCWLFCSCGGWAVAGNLTSGGRGRVGRTGCHGRDGSAIDAPLPLSVAVSRLSTAVDARRDAVGWEVGRAGVACRCGRDGITAPAHGRVLWSGSRSGRRWGRGRAAGGP